MPIVILSVLFISTAVFCAAMVLLYRNSRRNPQEYRTASRSGRRLVYVLIAAFVSIAVSITLYAVREIQKDVEENLHASLETVLDTTHETIRLWVSDQSARHAQILSDKHVSSSALALIERFDQGLPLLGSEPLEEIRSHFRISQNLQKNIGFFVINLDGINVGSMRDGNIGEFNPIFEHSPESVERALQGSSVLVPAIVSDVPLDGQKNIRDRELPPTMFLVSPIYNSDNSIVGFLSERYDPRASFSKILQFGRIGESGESYAINSDGVMISESRFEDQLIKMGMLTAEEQSILSIPIVEPMLIKGEPVFTKMAADALNKNKGFDVKGYLDYRGVLVVGAWLWDEELNFGMTTEMDLSEGLAPFYKARLLILVILAVTLAVAISYSLVILAIGNRTTRYYEKWSEDLEQRVEERTNEVVAKEHMLQLLINSVPAPLYMKDLEGRYTLVNDEFVNNIGRSRDEIYGKTDWDIFPSEFADTVMMNDKLILESGEAVTLEEVVTNYRNEPRVYQSNKMPVITGNENVTGLVGVSVDISERIETENQLKEALESLAFVQHAVDSAAYMVIWADAKTGEIIYANIAAQEFLSLDDDSLTSLYLWDLDRQILEEDYPSFVKDLRTGPRTYETLVVNVKGEEHPVDVTSQLVRSGTEERLVSFGRDITLHKRLENELISARVKAEEGSRAKSEFLASMSHEIRTPLNGVLGMIGLVRRDKLDPLQDEQLRVAQNSANSLLDIINDLLDFTKIEAQRLDIEELDFNVHDLLGDIAKSMAYRAEEKNLELILDLSELKQKNIKSDPTRVRQLVVNLLGNAIKFTQEGEVVLRAWLVEEAGHTMFYCSVKDSGVGIPEESLPTLFESFTQADASTTRKYGGTGLGLAICKKLCELMHGEITVESQVGEGSEFVFSIRIYESTQLIEALPNRQLDDLRVLIVDDIETNRIIFKAQIEAWGVQVMEARHAEHALDILRNHPSDYFDIALLDMNMPNMDGYELSTEIRKNEAWNELTLLLMTSTTDFIQASELNRVGIDGFFSKPVTPSDLHDALLVVSEHASTLREQGMVLSSRYLQTLKRDAEGESPRELAVDPHLKILLVEDNEINQMIAQGMLEAYALTCVTVNNGQEAIDFLKTRSKESPIDLILMDCQMPVLDGYAATENIRAGAAGEWARKIPVVAMTAHALQGDREKCFNAGMNDFVTKPIDQAEFHRVLARFSDVTEEHKDAVHKPTGFQDKPAMVSGADAVQWPSNLSLVDPSNPPGFAKMLSPFLAALKIFQEQAQDIQRSIKAAYTEKDFEKLRSLAHSLKGSSGNLGIMPLSKAASDIENAVRENGQCHALQISQISDLIERGRLDAAAILQANSQDKSHDGPHRPLHEVVLETIELLSENQVVSVELIQELGDAAHGTERANAIAEVADQLNNFEYETALEALQNL